MVHALILNTTSHSPLKFWTSGPLDLLGLAWTRLDLLEPARTCLDFLDVLGEDLLESASADNKYQVLGDVVDQGEALKSPTSLASLYRVFAGV